MRKIEKKRGLIHTAYIAVGANLGDRVGNCREGVDLLCSDSDVQIIDHSRYYHTAPMEFTDQPWFVNAAFSVKTALDPAALLNRLKEIEKIVGRRRSKIRFGPRPLDLDLIFYDDAVVKTEELIVPHPRMHLRAFVLCPICDIAPEYVHPVMGVKVRELRDAEAIASQKCIPVESDADINTAAV